MIHFSFNWKETDDYPSLDRFIEKNKIIVFNAKAVGNNKYLFNVESKSDNNIWVKGTLTKCLTTIQNFYKEAKP